MWKYTSRRPRIDGLWCGAFPVVNVVAKLKNGWDCTEFLRYTDLENVFFEGCYTLSRRKDTDMSNNNRLAAHWCAMDHSLRCAMDHSLRWAMDHSLQLSHHKTFLIKAWRTYGSNIGAVWLGDSDHWNILVGTVSSSRAVLFLKSIQETIESKKFPDEITDVIIFSNKLEKSYTWFEQSKKRIAKLDCSNIKSDRFF